MTLDRDTHRHKRYIPKGCDSVSVVPGGTELTLADSEIREDSDAGTGQQKLCQVQFKTSLIDYLKSLKAIHSP